MILNIQFGLVCVLTWISYGACASVSKVYVHKNEPVEYYQYGSQAAVAYTNPQFAQLTSGPVSTVVPYGSNYDYVSPCAPPSCVYPSQTVGSVAVPSANIVSYQSPIASLPIVAANRQEPGYEYSYVVYDQGTGDKKSHSELSDGSVVRGQYAFLQPDGYVREVKYVADDLSGFNVIVKNYLPNNEENKKDAPPCPEVMKENMTHKESEEDSSESIEEKHALSTEGPSHENLVHETEVKIEEGHGHTPDSHKEHEFNEALETKEHEKHSKPEAHEEHKTETPVIQTEVSHSEVSQTFPTNDNIYVPYNDIIKCITAALSRAQTNQQTPETALRYIVINKPC